MTTRGAAISRLADWSAAFSVAGMPENVGQAALRSILDIVGVMLAGGTTDQAANARRYGYETYAAGTCDVVGSQERLTAPGAAFINGTAAHALDFDDTCYVGIVHASAIVWPAVLAASQHQGGCGADALTAFVIGIEVTATLGRALGNHGYLQGRWNTTLLGSVGAAAGASRALGLSVTETAHAIAMATASASGVRSVFGSDAKAILAGKCASLGVEAALLSRAGVTGPCHLLDAPSTWITLAGGHQSVEPALDALGTDFVLVNPGMAFKLYPVCSAAAAAIDAALALRREFAIQPSDVASVRCTTTDFVASCLTQTTARTVAEAQFSMPYALAAAFLFGEVSLRSLDQAHRSSPDLRALMQRVNIVVGADFSATMKAEDAIEAASVRVTLRTGEQHERTVTFARGHPRAPATTEELADKFNRCCAMAGLHERHAAKLASTLCNLEASGSVRGLLTL
jgi:2-methylcitrate dehydratase PrpD